MFSTALAPVIANKTISNTVTFGTGMATFLIQGEDTDGNFSVQEMVARPGMEPPYHVHEFEDETFYVLEGKVSVMIDGQVHELSAGEIIFMPRGLPHTFRIRSEIARTLLFVTPAGFEKYFRAIGSPAKSLELPAGDTRPAPDYFETVRNAAARFGITLMPEQPEF